ncbi:MAG: PfkB family carbohydrate kinase [Nocardioides sp.]
MALSRLGRRVAFHTCYADDHFGAMLRDHLAEAGVLAAGDPAVIDHSSSAVATIGADGAASYEFDISWRLGPLALPDGAEPVVVHTSSIAAVLAPGADSVAELVAELRSRASVSYDINARPMVTGTGPDVLARIDRLVRLSDVVKASDEDLEVLYPGRPYGESARELLGRGPAAVVVTLGGDGAVAFTAQGEVRIDPVRVDVADTIGAGDTFGAALIDALWSRDLLGAEHRTDLHGLEPHGWTEVLGYAARAAAVTVSRAGANPPYRHELD